MILPDELQITAIICAAVQEDSATRQSNTDATDRKNNAKQERDKPVKWEGLEKTAYEFIQCLIYRQMWDSDRRWKTAGEVKKEVRALKLKKDKESGIKDNIYIHYKGLGRVEAKTTRFKNGNKKTIP